MRVIIIEDEVSALDNFVYLLNQIDLEIEVVKTLSGVASAIDYFKNKYDADVIFADVHLGDGIVFEIFETIEILTPIIFTTAYDQYAIKAFKLNSVDYLLKPIKVGDLASAVTKLKNNNTIIKTDLNLIHRILDEIKAQQKNYITTFLVHQKESFIPIKVSDIAYFHISSGLVRGTTFDNESFILDKKMEELEVELDPALFFRINRQFVAQRTAIGKINFTFNGKHTIAVLPKFSHPIVISKAKSKSFKEWMTNN